MSGKQHAPKKSSIRFMDVFIVVLCLSITGYSVYLFRNDLYQTINLQNVEPAGTIIIKNNVAQRRIADRILWDRLAVESPVYLGDLIRVAELSAATLNIDNQQLDLGENTLIRIQRAPDGEGFLIELSEGTLSMTTNAEGSLWLDLMGRIVEAAPGTALAASTGKEGLSLQVNEGTARFVGEDGNREIASGTKVAFDTEGVQRNEPAAVVTQPRPNARYVKSTPQALPVVFTWNRINLRPEDTLRLEIAADRNFNRIVQSVSNLNTGALVSLESGDWNWRLSAPRLSGRGAILASGKLSVVESSRVELLSPAKGSLFRYHDEKPSIGTPSRGTVSLRFQWSAIEEASHYVIEISASSEFASPQFSRETAADFLVESGLGPGTWYWRVKPVFSAAYEGAAAFSHASFFRIEQIAAATEPESASTLTSVTLLEPEQVIALLGTEQAIAMIGSEPVMAIIAPPPPPPPPPPRPRPRPAPTPAPVRPAATPAATPRPSPPVPLSTPLNLQPPDRYRIGIEQLRTERNIFFRWQAVPDANAYIVTLYEQTAGGRRQINRVTVTSASWTLENVSVLGRGTFVWQVEAINRNTSDTILRRGRPAEHSFVVDIPLPEVQLEKPGVLYGF